MNAVTLETRRELQVRLPHWFVGCPHCAGWPDPERPDCALCAGTRRASRASARQWFRDHGLDIPEPLDSRADKPEPAVSGVVVPAIVEAPCLDCGAFDWLDDDGFCVECG